MTAVPGRSSNIFSPRRRTFIAAFVAAFVETLIRFPIKVAIKAANKATARSGGGARPDQRLLSQLRRIILGSLMKLNAVCAGAVAGVLLLVGCGKSNDETSSQPVAQPATPTPGGAQPGSGTGTALRDAAESVLGPQARNLLPADAGVPASGPDAPAAAQLLAEVSKQIQSGNADWGALLKSLATSRSDSALASLGADLGKTAGSLKQSLEGKSSLTEMLDTGIRAVLTGRDAEALGLYDKLTRADLTPAQEKLAREVQNLVAAFLTHKNLSALDGAQGQVGQLVTALRQGNLAAVTPAVQQLTQNLSLTPAQKDFLSTLTAKYGPAVKELGRSLTPDRAIPMPPVPTPQN